MNTYAAYGYGLAGQYDKRFMAYIQEGNIFSTDATGNTQQVGVTLDTYQSLENTAIEYQKKLIELGAIEEPLTPEQRQERMMAQLMDELKAEREQGKKLMAVVEELLAPKSKGRKPKESVEESAVELPSDSVPNIE